MTLAKPEVVLVVESDDQRRALIEQRLASASCQVTAVSEARGAMAALDGPCPQLLLANYHLADVEFADLMSGLAARAARLPYLVIVRPGEEAIAAELVNRGARGFLLENESLAELLPAAVLQTLIELRWEERLREVETALAVTESRLAEAREELEQRVRDRTADLAEANVRLRVEMDERRRAEEESRLHQAEIAHIARLNALGEMVAELAHELNQPLSAIANYTQASLRILSRQGGESPPDVVAALQQVVGQASRAAQIIRRVRQFVAKAEPSRAPLDLNVAIAEIVELAEVEARVARATIRFEPAAQPLMVLADRIQIEQVLINLVHNSLEAMEAADSFPRELTIRSAAAGENVEVMIVDTGPGVPPDQAERLFRRFFTTKPQGIGMGLPISRSIIESHGGRLWLDAEASTGATFRFSLPQHLPENDESGQA